MKKEKMITRTILITEVSAVVINKETLEVGETTVSINKVFKKPELLENATSEYIDKLGLNLKLVSINHTEEKEILYGMPESEFIKNSIVLPPRTKKDSQDE